MTISGNSSLASDTGAGGGMAHFGGTADLTNVTFAANTAPTGRSIRVFGGQVRLKNTIVAHSQGNNCAGTVTSLGNNIDSGDTCALNAAGDQSNVDPKLGPLADNGGLSQTHALVSGSPALDTGTNSGCPSVDQRGLPRPRDGNGDGNAVCDVGAFEAQDPPPQIGCAPRPPVAVAVAYGAPNALIATIKANGTVNGAANRLRSLRFGRVTNATIDVAGQTGAGANQTVTLPNGLSQIQMTVRRGPNGDSATAELVVVDDCGDWSTLVGGGRDAWGSPNPASASGPAPVSAPAAVACTPRPPISVTSARTAPGHLQVTITAGRGGVTQFRLGSVTNAVVDVAGRVGLAGNTVVPISGTPAPVVLVVRRLDASRPTNVSLTITDGCGEWPTFVGGGVSAF